MKFPDITHEEIDVLLDPAAGVPEEFERIASECMDELDSQGRNLEITDPLSWRAGSKSSTNPRFENQFRADVERIVTLDRQEEARLARRIEFARLWLERTCSKHGWCKSDCLAGIGAQAAAYMSGSSESEAPQEILRRAAELHTLRTEMVERNLYLVLINVERYAQSGASRTDLIQEGSAALYRAVDGFDWRRGLLFRTYAVHWLNQAFRNYLYNFKSTVRVPVYLQKAMKHINQAQIQLGDPSASPAEIADQADLDEKLVASAMSASRSSFSLDSSASSDDDGNRLRDLLVFEDDEDGPYSTRLEDISLESGLASALGKLSDRERLVLGRRFGLDGQREHTLAEVAEELGVSVERIRQIQVRAISKLKTPTLRRELDPFLN